MERYDNIVKIAKIKKLMAEDEKEQAYELVSQVSLRKVKQVLDLLLLADTCAKTKHYEEAKPLYQKAYDRAGSKRALSQLVYLSIKTGDTDVAAEYLTRFEEISPEDPIRLVYRFLLQKKTNAPITEQIATLEQLKEEEYIERWAYELAKLYHKVGDSERCARECGDIILWFGEGEYVEWARILRGLHLGEIDIEELQKQQEELRLAEEVQRAIGNQEVRDDEAEEVFTDSGNVEEITADGASASGGENGVYPQDADETYLQQNESNEPVVEEAQLQSADEVVDEEFLQDAEAQLQGADEVVEGEFSQAAEAQLQDTEEVVDEDIAQDAEEQLQVVDENFLQDAEVETDDENGSEVDKAERASASATANKQKVSEESETETVAEAQLQSADEAIDEAFSQDADETAELRAVEAALEKALEQELAGELGEVLKQETTNPEPEEADTSAAAERVAREEEAILYMSEFLNSQDGRGTVPLRSKERSAFQPEEGGRLSRLLLENELELEDIFGNYARMDGIRKQLVRALDIIFDARKRGDNIIITGGDRCGKTTLAKKIAKIMYRFGILKTTKVALVEAEKLNNIDVMSKKEALLDCCLIIEHAGKLEKETVEKLLKLNPDFYGRTVVFLEDQRNSISRLLRDNPALNSVYNNRIHLPNQYRLQELKGFVYEYLIEREYELDKEGDKALEECLRKLIASKPENPVSSSILIGKEAIHSAEKRTAKSLADLAETGEYENADIMILHKADFLGITQG